jgi:hypothetical protein
VLQVRSDPSAQRIGRSADLQVDLLEMFQAFPSSFVPCPRDTGSLAVVQIKSYANLTPRIPPRKPRTWHLLALLTDDVSIDVDA